MSFYYSHTERTPVREDKGPGINRRGAVMFAIAVVVVALRFFTRGRIVRKFGCDDLGIAVALALAAAQFGTIVLQTQNGRGRHVTELEITYINKMLLYEWIELKLYYVGVWAVKMSILSSYHRIGHGRRGLPWILHSSVVRTMAVFLTCFMLSAVLAETFSCLPVSKNWEIAAGAHRCIDLRRFNIAQAAINVVTDLMLLLFPIPLVRQLQVSKTQRVALIIVFSIGLIPLAASIGRLSNIAVSSVTNEPWLEQDATWKWAYIVLWGQGEVDCGIVAASLPSISPLLKHMVRNARAPTHETLSFHTLTHPRESQENRNRRARNLSLSDHSIEVDEMVDFETVVNERLEEGGLSKQVERVLLRGRDLDR